MRYRVDYSKFHESTHDALRVDAQSDAQATYSVDAQQRPVRMLSDDFAIQDFLPEVEARDRVKRHPALPQASRIKMRVV